MARRVIYAVLAIGITLSALAAAAETPLAATREWAAAAAAAEGLYPGGMAEAPDVLWTLYAEGITALQGWELETAENSLRRALENATRDSERLAVHHALAVVSLRQADSKQALVHIDRALALADAGGDRAALAYVLKDASQIHRLTGDTAKGLALAKRGSEIAAKIDNPHLKALYQLAAVEILFEMGDLEAGRALLDEAEPVFAENCNDLCSAEIEFYRGYIKYREGDLESALASCHKALEVFQREGDRHSEAKALDLIGICLENQKDYDGALASHSAALEIYRALDDRICEGKALLLCAEIFKAWGQYDSAVTALNEAITISRDNGIALITVEALKSRALCELGQEDLEAAKRSLEEARKAAVSSHNDKALRQIDFVVACLKLVKGNLDVGGAIKDLTALEESCKAAGDQQLLAGVCGMLAEAYTSQEDIKNVIRYRARQADAYIAMGDKKGAARALSELSLRLMSAGFFKEALVASVQALRFDQELGDRNGEGYDYRGAGICLMKLKRYDESLTALEKAAEIHHELGNSNQLGRDYLYLCALARLTGRDKKAEEFAAAATELLGDARMVELVVTDALAYDAAEENPKTQKQPAAAETGGQTGTTVKPPQQLLHTDGDLP